MAGNYAIWKLAQSQTFIIKAKFRLLEPGRVAQSVRHLTHKSEVLGSIPGPATYFRLYEVLVNRLEGLSLPRKSVARLTDRSDMTFAVDVKQ